MGNFLYCDLYDGYAPTNSDRFPNHIDKSEFEYLGKFLLNTNIIEAIYYSPNSNYIELRLIEDNPVFRYEEKGSGIVFTYVYIVFETDDEASDYFELLINKLYRGMKA